MTKKPASTVEGIRCKLRKAGARKAVGKVLRQIKQQFPKDYERLKSRVREIRPLTKRNTEDGTLGEWKKLSETKDPRTWGREDGVLYLKEDEGDRLIPTTAHELGHTCTQLTDLLRRGEVPFEEWASELTADWYAYKWGFGRQIAKARKTRNWNHHGPPPGGGFTLTMDGRDYKFRVSRRFVVTKEESNGSSSKRKN